jgi:hypothetical protein
MESKKQSTRIILWCGIVPCILLSPLWGTAIAAGLCDWNAYQSITNQIVRQGILFLWGASGGIGTLAYFRVRKRIISGQAYQRMDYVMLCYGFIGFAASASVMIYALIMDWGGMIAFITTIIIVLQCMALKEVWRNHL